MAKGKHHPTGSPSTAEARVILVGAMEGVTAGLSEALARRGVNVSPAPLAEVGRVAAATAPDLVVALGEAAEDSGTAVMNELGDSTRTSVIPVALVTDEPELDARLSAFRHGVCAVIRRQASVDAIAEEIARVVREVPERASRGSGTVGEVTLEELVGTLSKQLRAGILSVRPRSSSPHGGVRLVLGAGRPISEIIDDFVRKLRGHVLSAEPLEYEFDQRALGTIELLEGRDNSTSRQPSDVHDLRVLLADDDPGRADAVAQELRRAGATVMVTDLEPSPARFTRLRELDPVVLLVGKAQLEGTGYELVQRLRADFRFGWASLLVVEWDEIWPEQSAVVNVDRLLTTLEKLSEPERSLVKLVDASEPFEVRLESTGPARLLRALVGTRQGLKVEVSSPRALVRIDLSGGLVVGAMGQGLSVDALKLEGATALAALLRFTSGRVRVEPAEQPSSANLMTTADVALEMAMAEPPPLAASAPPPRGTASPEHTPARRVRHAAATLLVVGLSAVPVLLALVGWLELRKRTSPDPEPRAISSLSLGSAARTQVVARKAGPPPVSSLHANDQGETPGASSSSSPSPAPSLGKALCEGLLAARPSEGEQPWLRGTEAQEAFRAVMRGDKKGAKLWYCRALEHNDGDVTAAAGLVRLLIGERDGQTAAYWAERCLLVHPHNARVRALLGDALALGGDEAGARKAWLEAARVDASDAPGIRKLSRQEAAGAERAYQESRLVEAERLYRRVAILTPEEVAPLLALTRLLLAQSEARQAASWAERAIQVAPGNAVAWIMLGDARARTGDREGARAAWVKAQSLAPADPEVRHRMSQL